MTTTVAVPSLDLETFPEFARALEAAVGSDALDEVERLGRHLDEVAIRAIATTDLARMAGLGSRISRLRRRYLNAGSRDEGGAITTTLVAEFDRILRTLDLARDSILTERLAELDDREVRLLRDKILTLLQRGPIRPRVLADELGVDPTQVSRALRELVDEGRAKATERSGAGGDRRGRWYRAVAARDADDVTVEAEGESTVVTPSNQVRAIAVLRKDGTLDVVDRNGKKARKPARASLAAALARELV